jgi:hypothetical protein
VISAFLWAASMISAFLWAASMISSSILFPQVGCRLCHMRDENMSCGPVHTLLILARIGSLHQLDSSISLVDIVTSKDR